MLLAKTLLNDSFDAVISDIRMPGYDGHTFCRNLRSSAESKDLVVIASSGSVFADDQRLLLLLGLLISYQNRYWKKNYFGF